MQNGSSVCAGDGGKTDFSGKHGSGIIQNDLEMFSSPLLVVRVPPNLGVPGINFIFISESTTLPLLFNLKVVFPFLLPYPTPHSHLELSTKRQRDYIFSTQCLCTTAISANVS